MLVLLAGKIEHNANPGASMMKGDIYFLAVVSSHFVRVFFKLRGYLGLV